jgi:hypothetical protein
LTKLLKNDESIEVCSPLPEKNIYSFNGFINYKN